MIFFPIFKPKYMLYFIIGLCIGFLLLLPALLVKKKANYTEYHNSISRLQAEINDLYKGEMRLRDENKELEQQLNHKTQDLNLIRQAIEEKREEIKRTESSILKLTETENAIKNNMERSIEERSEALSKEYQEASEQYKKEYMETVQEMTEEFSKTICGKRSEVQALDTIIGDKQTFYDAILAMEQRKAKQEAQKNFYRLVIPEEDLVEIEKIKEITPYLRNPEILNKVLWTTYYQKPYQDLVARQFGNNRPTGIYKITCLLDDKVYIGQSVNVPNRFSEHIKRGLGAEPATKNRLYPAMKKYGVENFVFELLEEVSREKLDERERYWIQFFHSAEFGLNGNKGVKG